MVARALWQVSVWVITKGLSVQRGKIYTEQSVLTFLVQVVKNAITLRMVDSMLRRAE